MTVEVVTFFSVLMKYAGEEGQAKLHGTPEEYAAAKEKHEGYRQACLAADRMVI
jgi:hypothetical protein